MMMEQLPHRSSDKLIIQPDDGGHNILQVTQIKNSLYSLIIKILRQLKVFYHKQNLLQNA